MLQQIREENFPKDDAFISNIELIKVDLGEEENLLNLAFCPLKENFINFKKNKKENIVFFTIKYQLNVLSECEGIFIDGTFKMAPKNYYQILNFWGYLKTKKIYLPLLHALMTSKSQQAYNHVFNSLLQLLNDFNIEVTFENKIITTDCERSLRNSINKILKPNQLNGCYFHFSKALWKKCHDYGLTAKKFRKDSMLNLFAGL